MKMVSRSITFCVLATILWIAVVQSRDSHDSYAHDSHDSRSDSECGSKADIVVICDASRSIWGPDFKKQIAFVLDVAKLIRAGEEGGNQISLVTYGEKVVPIFQFNTHKTKQGLHKAIDDTEHLKGGKTMTDLALEYVRTNSFLHEKGARRDVPKVVILMTDGKSRYPKKTKEQAMLLKKEGVTVFAMGIGRGVSRTELTDIASDPPDQYVFIVRNFNDLKHYKEQLAYKACEVTTTTPATTTTTTPVSTTTTEEIAIPENVIDDCESKPADVVLVCDTSGSIGQFNFEKVKQWLKDYVDVFDLGPDATRIGIVSFNDNAFVELDLADTFDMYVVKEYIEGITYGNGGTNTASAIDKAVEMLRPAHGSRTGAAHIIVVLTDGQSKDPLVTSMAAKAAQQRGIIMFAVGITDQVDKTEMKDMASNPNDEHMFFLENFDRLDNTFRNKLAAKTCIVEKPQRDSKLCGSGEPADIVFGLDLREIGGPEVHYIMEFIKRVAVKFDIDSGVVRAGVTTNCPSQQINLKKSPTRSKFAENIDVMNHDGLASLMKRMRTRGHSKSAGSRAGAKKISLMFVSGAITDEKQCLNEHFRARNKKQEVFAIALNSNVNMTKLTRIVSKVGKEHVLDIEGISQLGMIEAELEEMLCDQL